MTRFVEVEGARLEYLDIPAAAPGLPELLLLHEGLGSVSMWRDFPQALATATGCRTLAYSRRGFGRSSPLERALTPRFMHEEALETLPQLRAALSIRRPVLVGHSTGASMALLHAAAGRWSVAGVVAMAPFAFVEASNLETIASARDAYASTDWRGKLARHHDDVDAVFRAWADIWLDPAFRSWAIVEDLQGLAQPVLAILGENDRYSSPAQCEAIARAAARVEVLRIADCGHVPWRERPEIVVPATAAFVARVAPVHGKPRFER